MVVFCVLNGIRMLLISRKALPRHEDMMAKFVILTQKEK